MLTRYTVLLGQSYSVEWLNDAQVAAYKVCGAKVTEYC
jgi:hypothetical protein